MIVRTFAAWRGDCLKDWTLTALDRARNARAMRPSSYIEIDGETLTQLYVQDCLPMTEIAKRLGCSSITVARRLRLHDIASRPRGPVPLGRTVSGENSGWSPDLAWAIGLIATDGNLSPDGRHLVVRSKDYDMLETLRRCLRLTNRITATSNGRGGYYHTLQWSDRAFYRWLLQLGLTPAKSLTLRPLAIPDDYFADFFRGCIDGDGSVRTYTDRYHVQKNEAYVYERLYLSIVSASRAFIEWLQTTVARLTGVAGSLTVRHKPGAHPLWMLCYAKAKSIRLIAWMYYAATLPCLERNARGPNDFSHLWDLRRGLRWGGHASGGYTMWPRSVEDRRASCRSGEMQTRGPQKAVPARACGFESRLRHQPQFCC